MYLNHLPLSSNVFLFIFFANVIIKTIVTVFHQSQQNSVIPEIKINNNTIEYVDNFNFLGLTLNNHLQRNFHNNKLSCAICVINKIKYVFPFNVLMLLHDTLVT